MIDADSIAIDRATEADVDAIQTLERACFGQAWTREQYLNELADTRLTYSLVARERELVVAYASLQTFGDEAHIPSVAVRPEYRRRGLGRRLVERLLRHAVERGVAEVWLEVRSRNEPAIALYEQRGFVTAGRRRNYYDEPLDDGLLMVLRLASDETS